jgi:predicted CoA-binding protein
MKTIPEILNNARTIAVVGLSSKPERASFEVAQYLQQQGYKIIPVNPSYAGEIILGEKVYATLQEAAGGGRIDIVDCFRKAEDIPAVANDAIAIEAGCLWMQLGIENHAAREQARSAGLDVVMDHCMKVEHARLDA